MYGREQVIRLNKKKIQEIMKNEKDLYELNINGFDCIIYRYMGHLNGYVIIKDIDPYYELNTNELEVHGGITYQGDIESLKIKGLTKDYSEFKCIGFDTGHAGDAFIKEGFEYVLLNRQYRDYNYVYNELVKLTEQLIVHKKKKENDIIFNIRQELNSYVDYNDQKEVAIKIVEMLIDKYDLT